MADQGGVSPTDLDGDLQRARDAIKALRKAAPNETPAQARARSCELIAAQRRLAQAARRTVTDAVTAKRNPPPRNGFGATGTPAFLKADGRPDVPVSKDMQALVRTIAQQFAKLEKRIDVLEARPSMKYEGTWDATKAYSAGDFATHQGGLWHCEDGNVGVRPGTGGAWKLAVKRG